MTRAGSFAEFWPRYLREHSRPGTRALHHFATSLVVMILIAAVALRDWRLLLAAPVAAYSLAWIAHFAVERNRPATFTHPAWSLRADFLMWWLWVTGRLGEELRRAGLTGRIGDER